MPQSCQVAKGRRRSQRKMTADEQDFGYSAASRAQGILVISSLSTRVKTTPFTQKEMGNEKRPCQSLTIKKDRDSSRILLGCVGLDYLRAPQIGISCNGDDGGGNHRYDSAGFLRANSRREHIIRQGLQRELEKPVHQGRYHQPRSEEHTS